MAKQMSAQEISDRVAAYRKYFLEAIKPARRQAREDAYTKRLQMRAERKQRPVDAQEHTASDVQLNQKMQEAE